MKRAITSAVFVISFVSLLVLGLVSRVQAGDCSNNSLKGTYGLSCEGTVVGVGPLAVIGVFTADGDGNGSEVETISFKGLASPAGAKTIVVTTLADTADPPFNADSSCGTGTLSDLPSADGLISLREAIIAANNTKGADTITFAPRK